MGKLTDKVTKGLFWTLLEKCGTQFAHFVVTLVLARLLSPDDYGTVALITVFISFSDVLVDCGLPKALVQKKDARQIDYDTVFYLSVAFANVLYLVLFFAAPFIAGFYSVPDLSAMLRVLAVTLFFHSVNGVQNVELSRKMLFRLSFLISWPRVIVSSVTGIVLACRGYGPWALVWSQVAGGFTGMVARQFVIRWRPTLEFSWASARQLFSYGWKMAVASLVTDLYQNLYALLIGKFYTRADLAFVRKGSHLSRVFSNFVSQSLRRVSFPALVKLQDDAARLRNAMRRLIVCSSFAVFPILCFLAVTAEPTIVLLFGEKWLPAVPYARLACFTGLFIPFNTINVQALTARGQSGTYLKIVIFRRVVGLLIMAATLWFGVFVFMASVAFILGPLGCLVTILPNRRELGYGVRMQVRDVFPSFAVACAAGAAIVPLRALGLAPVVELSAAGAVFAGVYAAGAWIFRLRGMVEAVRMADPRIVLVFPRLAGVVRAVAGRCAAGEESKS